MGTLLRGNADSEGTTVSDNTLTYRHWMFVARFRIYLDVDRESSSFHNLAFRLSNRLSVSLHLPLQTSLFQLPVKETALNVTVILRCTFIPSQIDS